MKRKGRQRKIKGTFYVIKIRMNILCPSIKKVLLASQTIWNVTEKFLPIPMWRHSQAIRHTRVHGANTCTHRWRCTFRSGEQASKGGGLGLEGEGKAEPSYSTPSTPHPGQMHKLKLKTVNNLLKVTWWLGIVETWLKSQKIRPKSLRLF